MNASGRAPLLPCTFTINLSEANIVDVQKLFPQVTKADEVDKPVHGGAAYLMAAAVHHIEQYSLGGGFAAEADSGEGSDDDDVSNYEMDDFIDDSEVAEDFAVDVSGKAAILAHGGSDDGFFVQDAAVDIQVEGEHNDVLTRAAKLTQAVTPATKKRKPRKRKVDEEIKAIIEECADKDWKPSPEAEAALQRLERKVQALPDSVDIKKHFPFEVYPELAEADSLVRASDPQGWRVLSYYARLMKTLPFSKNRLHQYLTNACKVKAVTEAAEVVETRFNELKIAVTTVLQSSKSDASATDANGWFKWSKHTRRALHAYICAADDWAVVADTLRKLPKTERVALNISSEPIRHIKSRQEHFDKAMAIWPPGAVTLKKLKAVFNAQKQQHRKDSLPSKGPVPVSPARPGPSMPINPLSPSAQPSTDAGTASSTPSAVKRKRTESADFSSTPTATISTTSKQPAGTEPSPAPGAKADGMPLLSSVFYPPPTYKPEHFQPVSKAQPK